MARDEAPPFQRGDTYYNGETIDVGNLGGVNHEGKEYVFEVNAPGATTSQQTDPSGRSVRCKIVRNRSGAALKGKRLAHFQVSASYPLETSVDGYTFADTDEPAGVIDEFLPPAGVPNNDLFFLVIDGPSIVTTADASLTSITLGGRVAPAAGTSLTSTNSGKLNLMAASPTVSQFASRVGRAAAAVATVTTDCPVMVHTSR